MPMMSNSLFLFYFYFYLDNFIYYYSVNSFKGERELAYASGFALGTHVDEKMISSSLLNHTTRPAPPHRSFLVRRPLRRRVRRGRRPFLWGGITSYISNQSYGGNQLSLSGLPIGPASFDITI